MNLSFLIAKRYLFSKKKHNAINIISAVSVCGVTLATLTLVCTLSVFNGFQDTVTGFFTAFDPELKITVREGKVFDAQADCIHRLRSLPEIAVLTETLEENAMVQYKDKQVMAVIKGVEDNFEQLTAIDDILYGSGKFMLHDPIVNYGIPGIELISKLGTGIQFTGYLSVYAPKRNAGAVNMNNPMSSFNIESLYSAGVAFVVNQQKYDGQYILTSLDFARRLLDYQTEVSAIELKLSPAADVSSVKTKIESIVGDNYFVQTRYEQQLDVFRIMEVEKLISYLFLTFILVIACFNVIGSLSMLILDKTEDIITLRNLGADNRIISRIFLFEGCMISFFGALTGILSGITLCFIQQKFGIISMGANGGFAVSAYPVSVHVSDVLLIFITVLIIGFLSVWYPVYYLSRRLLRINTGNKLSDDKCI
ncbi:Lipoprotein-releasing system transmembrane protein LolE [termite gut metagenome]|uniref:Lipoprotein-releasing system transmembrane protein LolE n=2 Tax=termite gut metagenome TaxID=433724 RepID=A0A5J4SKJ3_9ZZZZ